MGLGKLNPGCKPDPCKTCEGVPCCDARKARITFSGLTGCVASLNGDYTLELKKSAPQNNCCYISEWFADYSADFFDPRNCIPADNLAASCEGWSVPPGTIGGSCGNGYGIPVLGGFTIKYNPRTSNGYGACAGVGWTSLSIDWFLWCFTCGPFGIGSYTNACGRTRPPGFCSPESRHISGFRWFTGQSCESGNFGLGSAYGYSQISERPTASVLLVL